MSPASAVQSRPMNAKAHGFAHKCHRFQNQTRQPDIQNNKLPKTSKRLRSEAACLTVYGRLARGALDVTYLRGGESVPLTKERRLPRGRSYPTPLSVDYASLLSLLYLDAFVIWSLPARRLPAAAFIGSLVPCARARANAQRLRPKDI